MKLSFELSSLALKDLEGIWDYTAEQWSKEQANKYYMQIFTAINNICSNPKVGTTIDEIKKDHRKIIVKSHMIIFKKKSDTIYIDRILHQRMDINKQIYE